ncbi:DUF4345 domain-containing protein [Chryseotalea sanaruensis]|uniref:DUF4345 domain-containing protein n=1 Tax=Chryseotalea sanaruensis TaxID=2482724 RepID=A0A401U550_9BACT|nr:DUF4345 domain-containing protein [Chryseotalea sanaruensis]GCC50048.1 DUF4345 domain-containing protein [Chryseotalea sanaruensis]
MKAQTIYTVLAKGFMFLSALSLAYVALLAIKSPQAVMDLVNVKLGNNDALSSIRGVYGGVGVTLVIVILYLTFYQLNKGLAFISIFWGSYALSRVITLLVDGNLGEFGNTWLAIETIFCLIGLSLLIFGRKFTSVRNA